MNEVIEIKKNHRHVRMFKWPCRLLAVGALCFGWLALESQTHGFRQGNEKSLLIIFFAFVVAWAVVKIPALIEWIRNRSNYRLTEHGVEKTWRMMLILNEQTVTIPYKHIRLIKTIKRDTDYLFGGGVGSLFLDCAGTAQPEIRMWSIESAAEVKAEIERRCA